MAGLLLLRRRPWHQGRKGGRRKKNFLEDIGPAHTQEKEEKKKFFCVFVTFKEKGPDLKKTDSSGGEGFPYK